MPEDPIETPEEEAAAEETDAAEAPAETAAAEGGAPRSTTHQEADYLRKLIEAQTPVSIRIKGGEVVNGVIEYYDSAFIRLTRADGPNLFIFKKDIMYCEEHSVGEAAATSSALDSPA